MRSFLCFQTSIYRLKWHIAAANLERASAVLAAELEQRYRPDQPRVPAGNPDGGQWTRGPQTLAPIISDANPDSLVPGAQYAQTEVSLNPSALTGISTIDDTTKKLTTILAGVMDTVEYLPGMTPSVYGTLVHRTFAGVVLMQRLPGIGWSDVETTFGGDYYGAKGSVRTDVVLRNDVGDIIAIYDVKTGNAEVTPRRAAELRQKTGTDSRVPIIQMSFSRGFSLKKWELRKNFQVSAVQTSLRLRGL